MDQLKKAAQEAAEKLKEKMAKNPLEKALNEATSDVNWNASNKVLQEIADHTYSFGDFTEVMKHIWKKMGSERKAWRRILKTLSLIEFLIKNGSPRCIQEFRDEIYQIRTLQDFSHYEDGQDRGAAIREVAKRVVQLLGDEQKIDEERKKAQEMRERLGDMRAFGSGGEQRGGYGGTGSGFGGGSRYAGHSNKDDFGGSKYAGGGSNTGFGSESYKNSGHYDDVRKTGSWRVEKTAEETSAPKTEEKHTGQRPKPSTTNFEVPADEKKTEKPKANIAGPGGKILPPKGSKIPTTTVAPQDDLLGGDPTPAQPTTQAKIDPFNWNAAPQTQATTSNNNTDLFDFGAPQTSQPTTTQPNQQNAQNSPFNWNQAPQNTSQPQPNIQNLYQQAQQPSQPSFGFPTQPQNNFNAFPQQTQNQNNMNNLTNQLGNLNFGNPQPTNTQPVNFGWGQSTTQTTTQSSNWNAPQTSNNNNHKNDGFDDFVTAKPTTGSNANPNDYKNYSKAEKSIIDLSDIADEASKKKEQKDRVTAAKNSNEGILYSTKEDLDNFFINPPQNQNQGGFNIGFQGNINNQGFGMNQGGFGMQGGFGQQGGFGHQQQGGFGQQQGGFGMQGNFGGMQGMNQGFNPNPMGGNFQGGFGNPQMNAMNNGFGGWK